MQDTPQLGQLLPATEYRRDAIHIAIAPVTAAEQLVPGQRIGFVDEGNTQLVGVSLKPLGIVDPYLLESVLPGQRFWMLIFPGTITSLRHIWEHPDYTAALRKFEQISQ